MINENKGCAKQLQTPLQTAQYKAKSTVIESRYKALVVTLAVWGIIPLGIADWINKERGDRDE